MSDSNYLGSWRATLHAPCMALAANRKSGMWQEIRNQRHDRVHATGATAAWLGTVLGPGIDHE